jgi:hypothetical protein
MEKLLVPIRFQAPRKTINRYLAMRIAGCRKNHLEIYEAGLDCFETDTPLRQNPPQKRGGEA